MNDYNSRLADLAAAVSKVFDSFRDIFADLATKEIIENNKNLNPLDNPETKSVSD